MANYTVPDNIYKLTNGDSSSMIVESQLQGDSIQAALTAAKTNLDQTREIYTYRWANATARGAETSMRTGDLGIQLDTQAQYYYTGTAWVLTSSGVADTGWVTSGLSFTAASGWTLNSYAFRRNYAIGCLNLTFTATAAVTVPTSGDIANQTLVTIPSPWYPARSQNLNSGGSGRVAHGYVSSGGDVILGAVGGTSNIASGDAISLNGIILYG